MADNQTLVAATILGWFLRVFYLLLPIDMIPDFIPLLGWLDDVAGILVMVVLTLFTAASVAHSAIRGLLRRELPLVYAPLTLDELRSL